VFGFPGVRSCCRKRQQCDRNKATLAVCVPSSHSGELGVQIGGLKNFRHNVTTAQQLHASSPYGA
jgi:hypothetical protein